MGGDWVFFGSCSEHFGVMMGEEGSSIWWSQCDIISQVGWHYIIKGRSLFC